jgi:hypothetical protein
MSRLLIFKSKSPAECFLKSKYAKKNDVAIIAPQIGAYTFNLEKEQDNPVYKEFLPNYANLDYIMHINGSSKIKLIELFNYNKKNNIKDVKIENRIKKVLERFDEIYHILDNCHSSSRAFDFKFNKYFNYKDYLNESKLKNIYYVSIRNGISPKLINNEINKKVNLRTNPLFLSHRNIYLKLDDLNFKHNFLSHKYYNDYFLSKNLKLKHTLTINMISTLLLIKKSSKEQSILFDMDSLSIGSAYSRTEIIKRLEENKLIIMKTPSTNNYGQDVFKITDLALTFVNICLNEKDYDKLSFFINKNSYDIFYDMKLFKNKYTKKINNIFEPIKTNI